MTLIAVALSAAFMLGFLSGWNTFALMLRRNLKRRGGE